MRLFPVSGYNQGRPSGLLHHPRGYNPHHTTMPALAIEDHAKTPREVRFCGKLRFNFCDDPGFFVLTLAVELIKLLRDLPATLRIFAGKKLNHVFRYVHAACSVDPRAKTKAHISGRQSSPKSGQSGDFHQSFSPAVDGLA